MSRERERAPGLLDLLLLPDAGRHLRAAAAAPPTAGSQPTEASAATGVADVDDAPAPRPRWGRRVGAFLFWGTAQGLFLLTPPPVGILLNLAVAAGFVWWWALRPAVRRDPLRRATYRLRPVPTAVAPWLLPVAAALVVFAGAMLVVVARFVPPPATERLLEAYARRPGGALAVLLVAVIVAPLLEEFLFRGWLQRALERRYPAGVAIGVTALVFSLAHLQAFGFPARLVAGGVFGYAAWRTRSIWPGVVLHGLYNGLLLVGGGLVGRLLRREADEAALVAWAHDATVFGPALAVALLALLTLAAALAALGRAARRGRPDGAAAEAEAAA